MLEIHSLSLSSEEKRRKIPQTVNSVRVELGKFSEISAQRIFNAEKISSFNLITEFKNRILSPLMFDVGCMRENNGNSPDSREIKKKEKTSRPANKFASSRNSLLINKAKATEWSLEHEMCRRRLSGLVFDRLRLSQW